MVGAKDQMISNWQSLKILYQMVTFLTGLHNGSLEMIMVVVYRNEVNS